MQHTHTSLFFFFNDTATTEIYTLSLQTLFRSPVQRSNEVIPVDWLPDEVACASAQSAQHQVVFAVPGDDQDRKSTRLNSCHSQISYAVFCLKKKKKRHHLYSLGKDTC